MSIKTKEVYFHVCKGNGQGSRVGAMDGWEDVNGNVIPFIDYQTDSNGNAIEDNSGNKVPKMVVDPSNPNRMIPKLWEFKIERNRRARFILPRDKEKVKQLENCGHNRDCNVYEGEDYSKYPKRFYKHDPDMIAREEKKNQEDKFRAMGHAMNIQTAQAEVYASILRLSTLDTITKQKKSNSTLITDIREYALNNYNTYIETIIDNENVEDFALLSYALYKGVITKSKKGYMFEQMYLGETEAKALNFIQLAKSESVRFAIMDAVKWGKVWDSVEEQELEFEEELEEVVGASSNGGLIQEKKGVKRSRK